MTCKLMCGDCIEKMQEIPDSSVDMILCDPPYGTTRNNWDVVIPFHSSVEFNGVVYSEHDFKSLFTAENKKEMLSYWKDHHNPGMWEQFCRIAKDNAAIVVFGSGMFTANCMVSAPKGMWRYNLIWEKTTPTGFYNAKKMPLRSHEDIMVFYKRPPTYNPQISHGHKRKVSLAAHKKNCRVSTDYGSAPATSYDSTDRYPKSVWKFKTDKQTCAIHPTQKPVLLCEELILTYTNEGDTVLDPTFGSGTTGVACAKTKRNFIGIEQGITEYFLGARRVEDAF